MANDRGPAIGSHSIVPRGKCLSTSLQMICCAVNRAVSIFTHPTKDTIATHSPGRYSLRQSHGHAEPQLVADHCFLMSWCDTGMRAESREVFVAQARLLTKRAT
eukprot:scaffold11300_cov32-Tisochrysis_lutea.AAC.5